MALIRLYEINRGVKNVYICGHSIGKVDKPYFLEIKKNVQPNADWVFYYYDDGQCSSHAEYVNRWKKELSFLNIDLAHLKVENVRNLYNL